MTVCHQGKGHKNQPCKRANPTSPWKRKDQGCEHKKGQEDQEKELFSSETDKRKPQEQEDGHLHVTSQMIVVAEGSRQKISAIFQIRVFPPKERVDPNPFEKSKNGEKCGYSDDDIDKLPELSPGANCMDKQIVNGQVVE